MGLLILLFSTCLVLQDPEPMEYRVKGVYLFKFAEYVDWPPEAFPARNAPLVIGILGEDPFGPALDQAVQNRTVRGRPLVLRRFKHVDQVQAVHVLYIGAREMEQWERIREGLRGRSILTVAEKGPHSLAVITFVLVQNKVRFEIDAVAAEQAELKLSSKLLGLATAVRRAG